MFENVNHPIKDGIIADNSTLSSRKIKELVESATELPTPAAGDAGKALTVGDDLKYGLSAIPVELPTPAAADIGKIVSVVSDGDVGAEYGVVNAPESDIFYFDVGLYQASTSSVSDGHDVALTGLTGTSFDAAKAALDAGKRVVARITIFDQLPTDITFKWTQRNYTIKKGDIHFMDFGGYIQGKTGAPMFYRGYFPPYDYASQGADGFLMSMFTPDNGTSTNNQVTVFLDNI